MYQSDCNRWICIQCDPSVTLSSNFHPVTLVLPMAFPSPYLTFTLPTMADDVIPLSKTSPSMSLMQRSALPALLSHFTQRKNSMRPQQSCIKCKCHPICLRPSPLVCLECLEDGQVPPPKCMVRSHVKMKKHMVSPSQKLLKRTWHPLIKVHQKQDPSSTLTKPNQFRRWTLWIKIHGWIQHMVCGRPRPFPTDLPPCLIGPHECITTCSFIIITWTPHGQQSFPLHQFACTGSQAPIIYMRFMCIGEETANLTFMIKSWSAPFP
jgi:hypothetical protein